MTRGLSDVSQEQRPAMARREARKMKGERDQTAFPVCRHVRSTPRYPQKSEICPNLNPNLAFNAKKYHKKGHNSVILRDKNTKKLHNLHNAISHQNASLCICIYNGFAEILDLRQTGITENLATFGQFFFV